MKIKQISRKELIDRYLDRYLNNEPIPTEIQIIIQEFAKNGVGSNKTSGSR